MPVLAGFLYIGAGGVLYLAYSGNGSAYGGALALFIGALGTTFISALAQNPISLGL